MSEPTPMTIDEIRAVCAEAGVDPYAAAREIVALPPDEVVLCVAEDPSVMDYFRVILDDIDKRAAPLSGDAEIEELTTKALSEVLRCAEEFNPVPPTRVLDARRELRKLKIAAQLRALRGKDGG